MAANDVLSNRLIVEWDHTLDSLVIVHPNPDVPRPLVQIRSATLSDMSFEQASQFIGERLVLLVPALRERYVDPATGVVKGATDA